jgi:hypothetical protein
VADLTKTAMQKLPFLALLILACALFSSAQTSGTYQFGDRQITIPWPDGFTSVYGRFPQVTKRFNATEDPGNTVLAAHVPEDFVEKLQGSENIDLDFYTKVSVAKSLRSTPVTLEHYKEVVHDLEKNFEAYMNPDGELVKQVEKNSEKGLAGIGKKTRIDTTSTKSLGFFQKNEHVFSAMSVNDANISGRMVTTLMTLSVVYVKQRLFYVYVYKMFPDDSAQKDLVTFTRRFTAGIVAANK